MNLPPNLPPIIDSVPPPLPPALPAAPPGPTWLDLLIGVAMVWAFDTLVGGVMAVSLLASGAPVKFGDLPLSPALILIVSIASTLFAAAVSWFFVCRRWRRPAIEGFRLERPGPRRVAGSVALGVVAGGLGALLMSQFSTGDSFMNRLASTPSGLAVLIVLALVVPPFEELYYRGFLFPVLERYLNGKLAVVLVAFWFGLAHAFQLFGDWIGLAVVMMMGLVWSWQRYRFQSLWPSILCHWSYNAALVVVTALSAILGLEP